MADLGLTFHTMKNTDTNPKLRLSEHFALEEFTRSATSVRLGIDNTPTAAIVERLRKLCQHVLEPLRLRFGVLKVTSGYRCRALNAAVGGAANSQHIRGEAADIFVSSEEVAKKMVDYAQRNLDFDQAILEHRRRTGSRWLHLSYTSSRKNRRMIVYKTL